MFVTGLSKTISEADLTDLFAQYGSVSSCQIMTDPHTRESRGFGFINMVDVAGADAAMTALNGHELVGRVLAIEKARRKRPRTPTPGRYFGPLKPRRMGRGDRYGGGYRDRDRYYGGSSGGGGGGRRYDDRPRYDDPYRRPRYEDRDRYYADRDRGGYGRYDDRERYGRDYRDPYDRGYERLPPRDERYRDERDRYGPPPPPPPPSSGGYREREYR